MPFDRWFFFFLGFLCGTAIYAFLEPGWQRNSAAFFVSIVPFIAHRLLAHHRGEPT